MNEVRDLIRRLIDERVPIVTRPAKVKSVEGKTCTVVFVDDDVELPDVRLCASVADDNNLRIIPKDGTSVLVTVIDNDEHNAFVSLADELESFGVTIGESDFSLSIDGIVMNGGDNGGMTITPELIKQLDKLTARVDGIINAIKSSAVTAGDGGAVFKTNMIAALELLVNKESFTDITNDKVMH